MLRLMSRRPRIALVGAGNLAAALAVSLRSAGYLIEAVMARTRAVSLKKAQRLAAEVGARVVADAETVTAKVIWFCVPDSQIRRAARALAGKIEWQGRIALHSSGALTSDALEELRERGAAVASVHPLMTFVRDSRPPLAGVSFAIEGDAPALLVARQVVKDVGAVAYRIRKQDKAAYHAWGTFASPLLTSLLAVTEQVATTAGVSAKSARRRMLPLLRRTLENYSAFGASQGFSGPIVRGDVDTVKSHLRALRKVRAAREVYVALARGALQYLPAKNKNLLRKALDRETDGFGER